MKQIDLMKQTERKKKVLAALCAVLCTGLLSGCSSGGVLDSKEKNEQLKDTILETYDALIGDVYKRQAEKRTTADWRWECGSDGRCRQSGF